MAGSTAQLTIKLIGQNQISGMLQGVTGQLKGLGAAVTAPAKGIGKLAAVGITGLGKLGLAGLGIAAVADSAKGLAGVLGVGLNSELETVREQFLAFTKDAGLTDGILADLRKEANATPFAFKELAKATASLIPASKATKTPLNDLIKTSELLAALNPAEGLEGAAFSLREALSGDFVSIIERFNLSRERINALKKQGVPALTAINTVLKEMGVDSELVARMGTTLTGRWSTFKDTIDDIRRTFSQPLFEELKRGLIIAQGFLDANRDAINAWATTWGQRIGQVAAFVIDGIGKIVTALTDLRTFIATGDLATGSVFAGFTTQLGLARDAALTFIGAIKGEWGGAADGTINPLVRAIGQIGLTLRQYVLPTVMAFGQLFKSVLTGDMGGALNALYEIIIGSRVRLASAFLGWLAEIGPPLLEKLGGFGNQITTWISANAEPFLKHFITEWLPNFVSWLADAGVAALPHLTTFLNSIKTWVSENGAPLLEHFITEWGPKLVNWVGTAALKIGPELARLSFEIAKWVAIEGIPTMIQIGLDLGGAFIAGVLAGLGTLDKQMRAELSRQTGGILGGGLNPFLPAAPGVNPAIVAPPPAQTQRPPVTAPTADPAVQAQVAAFLANLAGINEGMAAQVRQQASLNQAMALTAPTLKKAAAHLIGPY